MKQHDRLASRYRFMSSGIRLCIQSNPMDWILTDGHPRRLPTLFTRAQGNSVVSGGYRHPRNRLQPPVQLDVSLFVAEAPVEGPCLVVRREDLDDRRLAALPSEVLIESREQGASDAS